MKLFNFPPPMSKHSKKVLKISLGLAFLFLLLLKGYSNISPKVDPNVQYDIYGQDKYTYFGDARFQVMNWPTDIDKLGLVDYKYNDVSGDITVFELSKYLLKNDSLYISGIFYLNGWMGDKEGNKTLTGTINPNTGDLFFYEDADEIPNYLILNTSTGDAQYFTSLGTMSEEEQAIFNTDLHGKSCLKDRTCYEKGVNPPWWEFFTLW